MKKARKDLSQEPLLPEALNLIPPALPRNMEREAAGRARFLAEARQLKRTASAADPVSPMLLPRLNQWVTTIMNLLTTKERKPMFATIVSLLVSLALLAGGGAATAYAAQDSLPNDFLYPVKTWQEDLTLNLTTQQLAHIDRLLEYSSTRLEEIVALAALGEPVPAAVIERLALLNEQAIALAADLDEEVIEDVITKIHRHLRDQDQVMGMTRSNAPDFTDPLLTQAQNTVREQTQLVGEALDEPLMLKQQLQYRLDGTKGVPSGPAGEANPGNGQGGPAPDEPLAQPEEVADPAGSQTEPTKDGYGPGPDAGPEEPPAGPEYGPGPNYGPGSENGESYAPGDEQGSSYAPGSENGSYLNPQMEPVQSYFSYYYNKYFSKKPATTSGSGTQTQSGGKSK